jgi:hypothetical protein
MICIYRTLLHPSQNIPNYSLDMFSRPLHLNSLSYTPNSLYLLPQRSLRKHVRCHICFQRLLWSSCQLAQRSRKNMCGAPRVYKGSFEVLERILQKFVRCCTSFLRILSITSNYVKGGRKNPCGIARDFSTSFEAVGERY